MRSPNNQESDKAVVGVYQFREMFYLFFSRCFSKEVDEYFLENVSEVYSTLENLSDLMEISQEDEIKKGNEFLKSYLSQSQQLNLKRVLGDLARDYANLFLGVGRKTIALSESSYRDQSGLLFRDSYFDVKERYRKLGLAKNNDFAEADDHLSVELAYMATVCRLSIEAIEEDSALHLGYLNSQEEFLKEHLLLWIPAMVDMLTQAGNSLFYTGMTYLLNGFIKLDINLVRSLIAEVRLAS